MAEALLKEVIGRSIVLVTQRDEQRRRSYKATHEAESKLSYYAQYNLCPTQYREELAQQAVTKESDFPPTTTFQNVQLQEDSEGDLSYQIGKEDIGQICVRCMAKGTSSVMMLGEQDQPSCISDHCQQLDLQRIVYQRLSSITQELALEHASEIE